MFKNIIFKNSFQQNILRKIDSRLIIDNCIFNFKPKHRILLSLKVATAIWNQNGIAPEMAQLAARREISSRWSKSSMTFNDRLNH